MGITFIKVNLPDEPTKLGIMEGGKIDAATTLKPSVESFRVPSVWKFEFEKSYGDAVKKLQEIVRDDLQISEPDVVPLVPCLVDLKEARTNKEEGRIRNVHNRMAKIFASLVDRLVRYNLESRPDAFDALKQGLLDTAVIWKPYECDRFRAVTTGEVDGRKKKKKKKLTAEERVDLEEKQAEERRKKLLKGGTLNGAIEKERSGGGLNNFIR
tara:strand:+ start:54 stop:689 length:636 start_codon:yes stop_codon:yes gene_type:complete